jgi:hypothetical protein
MRLFHLPLHYWNDDIMRSIRNTLVTYINKVKLRGEMFDCAPIHVKIYLEKGLLEEVQLTLDNWKHIQLVDYEQLLFKCK